MQFTHQLAHPINAPFPRSLLTHPINTLSQHTLSTNLITHPPHTFSTHPPTHPLNPLSHTNLFFPLKLGLQFERGVSHSSPTHSNRQGHFGQVQHYRKQHAIVFTKRYVPLTTSYQDKTSLRFSSATRYIYPTQPFSLPLPHILTVNCSPHLKFMIPI